MSGLNQVLDLRKREEEEEEKSIPVKAYETSASVVRSSPNYQQTSQVNKRDFEKKVVNPDNLEKSGAAAQEDKAQGKQPSVSDQFFEAIGFFMPTIVGGLVGGALEGSEGAFRGSQLGMEAGKQYRDFQLAKQDRAIANQRQRDIKTFVNRETGEPISFNPETNSFEDLSGNVVDRKNVTQATTFRQERSLEQREMETKGVESRFAKRFNLDKEKLGQLSETQVASLGALDESLKSLSEIKKLKPSVNTGPFATRGQSAAEIFGLAPEKFTKLKTEAGSMVNNYIKAITGAQMSEPEAQRIMSVAPSISDDDATFSNKLKAFTQIVERRKGAILNAIKTGQPLKKEIADQMAKEAEAALEKIENASGKKSAVRDKINSMSPEQKRQRLLELKQKYNR